MAAIVGPILNSSYSKELSPLYSIFTTAIHFCIILPIVWNLIIWSIASYVTVFPSNLVISHHFLENLK